jgi:hypothetical protein
VRCASAELARPGGLCGILQHLRHIRGQIDCMGADMHELKTMQASMLRILANHGAHLLRARG